MLATLGLVLWSAAQPTCNDIHRDKCLRVSTEAQCSVERARGMCQRTCSVCDGGTPRIFVYPSETMAKGVRNLAMRPQPMDSKLVGETPWAINPGEHLEHGSYIAPLLYQRLQHYSSPPEQADLFIAFQPPYKPPLHEYTARDREAILAIGPEDPTYIGNDARLALQLSCREWLHANATIFPSLTYLTPTTEHRHIIVPAQHWEACGAEPEFSNMRAHPSALALRMMILFDVQSALVALKLDQTSHPNPHWRSAASRAHRHSLLHDDALACLLLIATEYRSSLLSTAHRY